VYISHNRMLLDFFMFYVLVASLYFYFGFASIQKHLQFFLLYVLH